MNFDTLPLDGLAGAVVFLDIDGTIVADKGAEIPRSTVKKVSDLGASAKLYLFSNGPRERTERFAAIVRAAAFFTRKPFPGSARSLAHPSGRTVVIGDKYLTDGLFARFLGAEFIKVRHMKSPADSLAARMAYLFDDAVWQSASYIAALRPWQWVKNLLIFAPIFFSSHILDMPLLGRVSLAFVVFSLTSSALYILNDLADRAGDALHPTKRFRPIASGRVSPRGALIAAFVLACAVALLLRSVPILIMPIILYVGLNALYSLWLKRVAAVDVSLIAFFYILRVVVGGLAAGVQLSSWIILCVFFGALFIVIGKRLGEYRHAARRAVLDAYSERVLQSMLAVSAALAVMSYAIWSVIGHPSASTALTYSTVFVALAVFRMLNRMQAHPEDAEYPEFLVFKDPWVLASFLAWLGYVAFIFYA